MTSLEYWKQRERAAAEEYAVTDEEAIRRTQEVYARLLASVNERINAFYSRYASAEGITMNLAEQAVSSFDVKAFEATAAKMVAEKDFSPQANQQLRLYNATMRINRLEMLKAYIGLDTIDAGYDLDRIADYYLTDRSRQEFERQAGILGNSVRPTAKDVDDIVHSSFYNATFSQRIWASMSELHDELSTILTNGIIQGINPRQMTSRMAERFNVSESDAERLLRTEMARVQTETQKQSFNMAGYEYYVFISLEGRACPVCAALDTGEPISIEDLMPGETAPPIHPQCRCSVAAWMDREQMEKELGFALDEEEAEEAVEKRTVTALDDCETVDEVRDLMKAQEWFFVDESINYNGNDLINLSGADLEAAKSIYRTYSAVFERYPRLVGELTPPSVTKLDPTIYGQCYTGFGRGGISMNQLYYGDYNRLMRKLRSDIDKGFHPNTTNTTDSIVFHELGHAIDDWLSNKMGQGKNPKVLPNGTSGYYSNIIRPQVARTTGIPIGEMKSAVSGYAAKNASEWFAESFSEYMSSDNPRPVALEVGRRLDKLMREV